MNDSFADSFWRDLVQHEPPGREGMVTVYDSVTNEYLGCMGVEVWKWLLAHREVNLLGWPLEEESA